MPMNATDHYLQFTGNGTLSISSTMTCDCLVAGAGGRGGGGTFAGDGRAGEVVYHPNLTKASGICYIQIGIDSATPTNRISNLTDFKNETVSALAGGIGGSQFGGSVSITNGTETQSGTTSDCSSLLMV